ncbi:MAG: AEC family transporter [Hyphomicrobiales bacterium]|nr:AEC family transporter [Hyphomicrobiales bacterium]
MTAVFDATAPIFLLIVAGYALFQSGLVKAEVWAAVEHVCFYLLFPALIVKTLSRADLTALPVAAFVAVVLGAVVCMAALLLAARPLLAARYGVSGPTFTSLFQGATRFHGFMALAIVGSLHGDAGIALCAIAMGAMIPMLNIINVAVLAVYGAHEGTVTARSVLEQILRNPLIIACLIGFALNLTGLPGFIYTAIDIAGGGGLGLGLLAVGAGLNLRNATETRALVAVGVLIRLVGMPAFMIALAALAGLTGLPRTVAIIAGAVPTASTAYVMARKMGGDAALMANIVTFQVLAAAVTLPLFIYIADRL